MLRKLAHCSICKTHCSALQSQLFTNMKRLQVRAHTHCTALQYQLYNLLLTQEIHQALLDQFLSGTSVFGVRPVPTIALPAMLCCIP